MLGYGIVIYRYKKKIQFAQSDILHLQISVGTVLQQSILLIVILVVHTAVIKTNDTNSINYICRSCNKLVDLSLKVTVSTSYPSIGTYSYKRLETSCCNLSCIRL